MDRFNYQDGELCCEEIAVRRIVESFGTPIYIYSAATLVEHYRAVAAAFRELNPIICYSVKSCPNLHICRLMHGCGAGFDVVSGGELTRALEAGGDPAKIVFAGVGKTDAEIRRAIDAKIGWFNIESESELANLIDLARRRGAPIRAALRINPDVDPNTHRYTTTGTRETKFGVDLERAAALFRRLGRDEAVRLTGLHLHLGSPVNSPLPYVEAIRKCLGLIDQLRADGFAIDMLDIGGGFGAHYKADEAPSASEYAAAIVPLLRDQALQIVMEPGRSIAANAGILVTSVLYLKQSGDRRFVIVDAGMNDLIRPALYDAFHFIWPVRPPEGCIPDDRSEPTDASGLIAVDVVGPVCESGDFFAKDRPLPPVERGDLLAVFSTGAYGMAMASNYNSRLRPPEVLVEDGRVRLIRRRETYDDLLLPERL